MRTLTTPLGNAVVETISKPGYLLMMEFPDATFRFSSRGNVVWNGQTWLSAGFNVEQLAIDGTQSEQTGSVSLFDYDNVMFQRLMAYGVADRKIDIWVFYTDNDPALGDVVHFFSGVGDDATIDPGSARVQISLQQAAGGSLFCPRRYVTREQGFSALPADGTIVSWNNEIFILGGERG